MKKLLLWVAFALAVFGALGASRLITQNEALVSAALGSLKFESVPPPAGIVGAPPKFKVTKATLAHLEKLMKEGKTIEVQGNGSIKILGAKK